ASLDDALAAIHQVQSRLPALRIDVLERDALLSFRGDGHILEQFGVLPRRPDQPCPFAVERDVRRSDNNASVGLRRVKRSVLRDNQLGGWIVGRRAPASRAPDDTDRSDASQIRRHRPNLRQRIHDRPFPRLPCIPWFPYPSTNSATYLCST